MKRKSVDDYSASEWMALRVKLLGLVLNDIENDDLLTIRELAIKLNISQKIVFELAIDQPGLDILVAAKSYAGIGEYESMGDYQIEFYDVDNDDVLADFSDSKEYSKIQFMINHLNFKNYAVDETRGHNEHP